MNDESLTIQQSQKLADLAADVFASNALQALRGPYARGAVPTDMLAKSTGHSRNTVAAHVKRYLSRDEAVPFDLVIERVFDVKLPEQQEGWEWAFSAFTLPSNIGPADAQLIGNLEAAFKAVLLGSFRRSTEAPIRDLILIGYLLHAVALLNPSEIEDQADLGNEGDVSSDKGDADTTVSLILDRRHQSYELQTQTYLTVIRWALRATYRRARPPFTERDLVVAMNSLFDGYLSRHLLDPDEYKLETLVDATWQLALSMSEPGFLHSRIAEPELQALVEAMLGSLRAGNSPPSIEELADQVAVDRTLARTLARSESTLLNLALDAALAGAFEIQGLASAVPEAAATTTREVLSVIEQVAIEYPPLIRLTLDSAVWQELIGIVEQLLSQSTAQTDNGRMAAQSRKMVFDARDRPDKSNWRELLEFVSEG